MSAVTGHRSGAGPTCCFAGSGGASRAGELLIQLVEAS